MGEGESLHTTRRLKIRWFMPTAKTVRLRAGRARMFPMQRLGQRRARFFEEWLVLTILPRKSGVKTRLTAILKSPFCCMREEFHGIKMARMGMAEEGNSEPGNTESMETMSLGTILLLETTCWV